MRIDNKFFNIKTHGQGLYLVTSEIDLWLNNFTLHSGLLTLLVRHTSCSLTIQENADPSARHDLENWLNRLVPENDVLYTHTSEGADDMPAHIKAALTATSLSIPVFDGQMALGTWQGVFLWEHRHQPQSRQIAASLMYQD